MVSGWSPPKYYFWPCPNVGWIMSFAEKLVSPDLQMWPEDVDCAPEAYAWSSHHFDDVISSRELCDRSRSLKALFDGAMSITRGKGYLPFTFTACEATDSADSEMCSALPAPGDVTVEPYSVAHMAATHRLGEEHLDDPITRYLFLARYDPVVKTILKYTGVQGLSYMTLYAYRDWMKDCGWDDKRIAKEAGSSSTRLNDFTNTANNPAYLGPWPLLPPWGCIEPSPAAPDAA